MWIHICELIVRLHICEFTSVNSLYKLYFPPLSIKVISMGTTHISQVVVSPCNMGFHSWVHYLYHSIILRLHFQIRTNMHVKPNCQKQNMINQNFAGWNWIPLYRNDELALSLLANLKETCKVKWACWVEVSSITSVVKGVMVVIPKWILNL